MPVHKANARRGARRRSPSAKRGELKRRLQQVKMLILDVDGVMTDGGLVLGKSEECKQFNTMDGAGIKYLQRAGIQVAIITGRCSDAVMRRAQELDIRDVHQKALKKLPVFQQLLANHNLGASEIAYIGDDLPDLPLLIRVGVPIAVANACPEVKAHAMFITARSGGKGAIREVAELILKAQGKWDRIVEAYLE